MLLSDLWTCRIFNLLMKYLTLQMKAALSISSGVIIFGSFQVAAIMRDLCDISGCLVASAVWRSGSAGWEKEEKRKMQMMTHHRIADLSDFSNCCGTESTEDVGWKELWSYTGDVFCERRVEGKVALAPGDHLKPVSAQSHRLGDMQRQNSWVIDWTFRPAAKYFGVMEIKTGLISLENCSSLWHT